MADTITVELEEESFSSISNNFIDYYMPDANGDFVKLYIYLSRLCSARIKITVSDIADHLSCTEKDVCRGIRYWIKQDALKLSYNESGAVTGIVICALKKPVKKEKRDRHDESNILQFAVPVPADKKQGADSSEAEASASSKDIPVKKAPTVKTLEAKLTDPAIENLINEANAYCNRNISQKDINSIIYIYDSLGFSFDLLEYLLEYCASIGKTKFSYIETVAINWYKNGITARDEAEEFAMRYYSLYTKIMKELGITSRAVPAPVERNFIDHWTKDLGFTEQIILEACRRALSAKPNSVTFNYVNGILESWSRSNVKTFADISSLDDSRKKNNTPQESSKDKQTSQDRSSSYLKEFEQLYFNEVNNS